MKESMRVKVEQLFSIKAAEYLQGDRDPDKTYRYDSLEGAFEARVRQGLGGHTYTDIEAVKKNLMSVIEAGYLSPLTDMKGDITAAAKRYRILRFEEDCAKICTKAPVFNVDADHSYYSDYENLTYIRYEKIGQFIASRANLGYVWAHQDDYVFVKLGRDTSYFPRALLPTQAKLVSLIYVEILKDKITCTNGLTQKITTKHPATLNLFADIHEVLASALRAEAQGALTHGYIQSRLLPIVFRTAPLLMHSNIPRVQDAAKWLLQHPDCADWDYVKDVWPETSEEE
jgi:hypothetical protein